MGELPALHVRQRRLDGQAGRGRRGGLGIAPILGLFTGILAFLGVILNFSFVLSGSAGVNPAFIIAGLLLVLAWRNAGWIGLGRFLLPRLGTPWQRRVGDGADRRVTA